MHELKFEGEKMHPYSESKAQFFLITKFERILEKSGHLILNQACLNDHIKTLWVRTDWQ